MGDTNMDNWRDRSFTERQRYLLESGELSDCSFLLEHLSAARRRFRVHKYPLCCGSPVFTAMLLGELATNCEDIRITDVLPEHFQKLLEYLYMDKVELCDVETALGVCCVANKYWVRPLVKLCSDFIEKHLSIINVCQVLEFARLVCNKHLEESCLRILCRDTDVIIRSDNFLAADRSTLELLMKQETICVTSELTLFQACMRWAEANKEPDQDLRDALGPVLSLLRFKSFSCEDFAVHVIPTKILTESEDREILIALATRKTDMPKGFSNEISRKLGLIVHLELHQKYPQFNTFANAKTVKWELSFSPRNAIIHLFGVELKAEKFNNTGPYEENLSIALSHQEFEIAVGEFKGLVSPGSKFVVYFDKPIQTEPYNYYTVHISYKCNYDYNYNGLKHKVYITGSNIQLKIDEHEYLHISGLLLNELKSALCQ